LSPIIIQNDAAEQAIGSNKTVLMSGHIGQGNTEFRWTVHGPEIEAIR